MFKLTIIIEKVTDSYYYGWIESNGKVIKGIVAEGETAERVDEVLKFLFGAKIAMDAGLEMVEKHTSKQRESPVPLAHTAGRTRKEHTFAPAFA